MTWLKGMSGWYFSQKHAVFGEPDRGATWLVIKVSGHLLRHRWTDIKLACPTWCKAMGMADERHMSEGMAFAQKREPSRVVIVPMGDDKMRDSR